jgi:hypothetical protein
MTAEVIRLPPCDPVQDAIDYRDSLILRAERIGRLITNLEKDLLLVGERIALLNQMIASVERKK